MDPMDRKEGAALRRWWIELERAPRAMMFGFHRFGVTAASAAEALDRVSTRVFLGHGLPPVRRMIADVDPAALDPEHVQDNMGDPHRPGIWFPLGFQD